MDINRAVAVIEVFLDKYRGSHPGWAPVETRVNPSGDDKNAVKLWLNFGPDVAEDKLPALEQEFQDALLEAHPEVKGLTLAIRSQAF
ncbi:MAG: hypothetical protein HY906_21710 [Deltaproteobacteria bacterium]|nr:hypothetical protein [Deltaproteobacteria bacterium]